MNTLPSIEFILNEIGTEHGIVHMPFYGLHLILAA